MKKKLNVDDFHKLIEKYYYKDRLPNGKPPSTRNFVDYILHGLSEKIYYTRNGYELEYSHRGLIDVLSRYSKKKVVNRTTAERTINILPDDIEFDFHAGDLEEVPNYILPPNDWKILVLSDIHIPYHDIVALKTAINYGRKVGVNCIILNGDTMDMYDASKYDKRPDRKRIKDEIEDCQLFLKQLRTLFVSEKIVFKIGNHDVRLDNYIIRKAPELWGIDSLRLNKALGLKELNIDFVESSQFIEAGKLIIAHGHEFGGGGGIHAARNLYLKANHSLLVGHFHRPQKYTQRSIDDTVIGVWVQGCLCGLRPEYMKVNNWTQGFSIVTVDKKGFFSVELKEIDKGVVY